MPRPLRPAIINGVYHITARGNNGESIFVDDYDRYAYLALLARARLKMVRIFAYGLMTNHLHLVLQTLAANISSIMHALQGKYAYSFNRRYQRRGHLFASRFYSKVIEDESQLLETTRYIHLNPVQAGIVRAPEDYPWTSYRYYVQPGISQTIVDPGPVLELISRNPARSSAAYERFVKDRLTKDPTARTE